MKAHSRILSSANFFFDRPVLLAKKLIILLILKHSDGGNNMCEYFFLTLTFKTLWDNRNELNLILLLSSAFFSPFHLILLLIFWQFQGQEERKKKKKLVMLIFELFARQFPVIVVVSRQHAREQHTMLAFSDVNKQAHVTTINALSKKRSYLISAIFCESFKLFVGWPSGVYRFLTLLNIPLITFRRPRLRASVKWVD